ncbi:topoisomerase C-terminal repeat-containing protein [Domibacillus indicus]|uniref:topoisomerase C-terminal repeat-containing protein n=1 Tax=Domibacillus indicus TaxID=1437523 RepID=UPI0009E3AEE6
MASKKLTEKNIKDLLEKGITSVIKGFKSKSKKPFEAKFKIEDKKIGFALAIRGSVTCPSS